MKKIAGTTLPGGRVSRQSQGLKGLMKPGNIRNYYFEKYLHRMVLNLTVYVINFFSQSILAYIRWKSPNWAKSAIMTSYTGYLYFFGIYGKGRPIAILWYQISIPQAFIFKVHRVVATTPLVSRVTKIAWLDEGYVQKSVKHHLELCIFFGKYSALSSTQVPDCFSKRDEFSKITVTPLFVWYQATF